VIVSASGTDTTELSHLQQAVAAAASDDNTLLLRVWRAGGYRFVAVPLTES